MANDLLADLKDLHQQATKERSHFYVGKCCERAIDEITRLRAALDLSRSALLTFERHCEDTRAALTNLSRCIDT
jgi:hypothetical protein